MPTTPEQLPQRLAPGELGRVEDGGARSERLGGSANALSSFSGLRTSSE